MKRQFADNLTWFVVFIGSTLSPFPLLPDILIPQPHYLAMSHVEWKAKKVVAIVQNVEEIAFFIVLGACIFLMIWAVIVGVWKRRYRRMFVWLLIALSVPGLLMVLGACFSKPNQMGVAGADVIVSPEPSESYEEYLKRVDCTERHICLKCYVKMQKNWRSQYCPECEPVNTFICEKCGGVKEERVLRRVDLAGEFDTAISVLRGKGVDISPLVDLKDWCFSNNERLHDIINTLWGCFGSSKKYCSCDTAKTTYSNFELVRALGGRDLQAIYNIKQLYDVVRDSCTTSVISRVVVDTRGKYGYKRDVRLEEMLGRVKGVSQLESVFAMIESDKWRSRAGHFKGWDLIRDATSKMKAIEDGTKDVSRDEIITELQKKLAQLLYEDSLLR